MSKVMAIFEKPERCRDCPCAYEGEESADLLCQLAGNADILFERFSNGPVPDWCPLQELKSNNVYVKDVLTKDDVIGPLSEKEMEILDKTLVDRLIKAKKFRDHTSHPHVRERFEMDMRSLRRIRDQLKGD